MLIGSRHTMLNKNGKPPIIYNYIGIKPLAYRRMRAYNNLSSYKTFTGEQFAQTMFQFSRVEFINMQNAYYAYPSNMTVQTYTMFNGRKMRTQAVLPSAYSNDRINHIFDHSTSTKFCQTSYTGGVANVTDVYDLTDVTYSALDADKPWAASLASNYTQEQKEAVFGVWGRFIPFAAVINISSNPLDISTYSRWQWYTANDTASSAAGSGQRQWVEGEIVGSNDGKTWWRLDVFNNIDMPTTNYALAYTGNLIPRKGDLWFGLDLMNRNWTNGISIDT